MLEQSFTIPVIFRKQSINIVTFPLEQIGWMVQLPCGMSGRGIHQTILIETGEPRK